MADLEAVEMIGDPSGPAMVKDEGRDTGGDAGPECVRARLNGVNPTVLTETRYALDVLLRLFAATLSTGENYLVRTNTV